MIHTAALKREKKGILNNWIRQEMSDTFRLVWTRLQSYYTYDTGIKTDGFDWLKTKLLKNSRWYKMPNRQLHNAVAHVLYIRSARLANENSQMLQRKVFTLHTHLTYFKRTIYVSADWHAKRTIMVYPQHVENLRNCQTWGSWQWSYRIKTCRANGSDYQKNARRFSW